MDQLLTSNIAAIVTTGAFLFYLTRKDKLSKETYDQFSRVIENHLTHSNQMMATSNKVNKELAKKLQKLTDTIVALDRRINGK